MTSVSDVPAEIMEKLSAQISAKLGLHYPAERWGDLLRGVRAMQTDLETKTGARAGEDLIQRLACSTWRADDAENLGHHLTVGETYFWREPQALIALQKHALPPLIEERRNRERRLRIWSAGCCTGEEPYSVGILLQQLLPDIDRWDVRIEATDLNSWFLNKAATGKYRTWSFRGTPQWVKDGYFRQGEGDTLEVLPQIKKLVHFARLNLATDEYPGAGGGRGLDIILCRNVLIYMEPSQAQAILKKFLDSLNEGGWLVLSATETWLSQSPHLRSKTFDGAILFHKQTRAETYQAQENLRSPVAPPRPRRIILPATLLKPRSVATLPVQTASVPSTMANGTVDRRASTYEEALALYKKGAYAQVAGLLETTSESSPPALVLLAKAYANSGQMDRALTVCDRALEIDKLCTAAYYLRATILEERGDIDGAMQTLSRALFLDSNFIMAHFTLGNLAAQTSRAQQAARHWKNTLQLLEKCEPGEILPESDDMTVGHLTDLVNSMLEVAR